jgi:hypothetical protein
MVVWIGMKSKSILYSLFIVLCFVLVMIQPSFTGFQNATERSNEICENGTILDPRDTRTTFAPGAIDYSAVWNRTYGGFADDRIYDMTKCENGGYALVGTTRSFAMSDPDIWVLRTDSNGNVVWAITLGGPGGEDSGRSIVECQNGDFLIAGYSPSAADVDARVDRIDADGNPIWTTLIGEPATFDYFYDVIETSSGCIVAVGKTDSWGAVADDVLAVCLDANGNEVWIRIYGGLLDDSAKSIIECSTGGYAILANTLSFGAGNIDFWLLRTDVDGNLLWNKTYGGTNRDEGFEIIEYVTGDFVMVGSTASLGEPNGDCWVVRVNSLGSNVWGTSFGGPLQDFATGIINCLRGGFAIVGIYNYITTLDYTRVVRMYPDGSVVWNAPYDGPQIDYGYAIEEVYPEEFAVAGTTNSYGAGLLDAWLFLIPGLPHMVTHPSDVVFEYGTYPYVDLSIESTTDIDLWWLADTSVFRIYGYRDSAYIYSLTPPDIGIYETIVHVNNTAGYEVYFLFFIHVRDTTAPSWTEFPKNQTVEFGDTLQYQLHANDLSGLNEWSLTGSTDFVIDSNGEITSVQSPAMGEYDLEVSVNDFHFNTLTTTLHVSVQDTIAPHWDEAPQDRTMSYGAQFLYDLNASDLSGISTWRVDNPEFSVDWQGLVRNLVMLAPGSHGVAVYVSDEYGNTLKGRFTVTVEGTSTTTTNSGETLSILGTAIPFIAGVTATAAVALVVIIIGRRRTPGK